MPEKVITEQNPSSLKRLVRPMLILISAACIGNSVAVISCIVRVMDHGKAIRLLQSQQSRQQQQPLPQQSVSTYPLGEADPGAYSAYPTRSESRDDGAHLGASGLVKIATPCPSSLAAALAFRADALVSPYRFNLPNDQADSPAEKP